MEGENCDLRPVAGGYNGLGTIESTRRVIQSLNETREAHTASDRDTLRLRQRTNPVRKSVYLQDTSAEYTHHSELLLEWNLQP